MHVRWARGVTIAAVICMAAVVCAHPHDDEPEGSAVAVEPHKEPHKEPHEDGHHEDGHHEHDHGHMGAETSANGTDLKPSPQSSHSHHHHGMSVLADPSLEPQQRLYWEQYNATTFWSAPAPNKQFLAAHTGLTVVSWVFLYPVTMMLSIAKSPLYLPLQTVQMALTVASLLCLAVYGATAPRDLYPNNSYSKMSIVLFFMSIVHWAAAVMTALADRAIKGAQFDPIDGADYVQHSVDDGYHDGISLSRLSRDSHELQQQPDSSIYPSDRVAREESGDEESLLFSESSDSLGKHSAEVLRSSFQDRMLAKVMEIRYVSQIVANFGLVASSIFTILNRPLFVVGYIYISLGAATGFRLAMGPTVFNLLAHFIKGGIFFLFGLLQLGRYLGAFADSGMAWNLRPEPSGPRFAARGLPADPVQRLMRYTAFPSMEFVESLLIFIYGATNVFLERLANPHGAWAHKDLQHVSIAFMYFGAGLCGILMETRWVRQIVSNISPKATEMRIINPFPAFTVFWTGVLMSQHEQALPLSTAIHMQWGYLFAIGALFRALTYIIQLIAPPTSAAPTRPFTELIVSFCLICGGMVFVQSNKQTVEAMIYRGLDQMFTLNVNVGITALIMAWEIVVMIIKGKATRNRYA